MPTTRSLRASTRVRAREAATAGGVLTSHGPISSCFCGVCYVRCPVVCYSFRRLCACPCHSRIAPSQRALLVSRVSTPMPYMYIVSHGRTWQLLLASPVLFVPHQFVHQVTTVSLQHSQRLTSTATACWIGKSGVRVRRSLVRCFRCSATERRMSLMTFCASLQCQRLRLQQVLRP